MKKAKSLLRLQRLIEVKQRGVKSGQLRLHSKRQDLIRQLEHLKLYRQEYAETLFAKNTSPLQMDDTKRFLQELETSIKVTQEALDSHCQSEEALQVVAGTLNSQQKSVERRLGIAIEATQLVEDSAPGGLSVKPPYKRDSNSD